MSRDQQRVVRFRPPYSNHMYYIECDFRKQAKLLVDWFRQQGAESAICIKYNVFNLYDYDLVTAQEVSRIKQAIIFLFEDDPVAQIMVEGKMEGMDGEELRALTDLDMIAFASKQKLIRRRINKAFPEGWTQ